MKRFANRATNGSTAVLFILSVSLAAVALAADDWKAPEDGVVTEKLVQDYLAYAKALHKFGGTWHTQTVYSLSELEARALNEASLTRGEIQWVKPRVVLIARHLVIEGSTPETWAAAEKRANEKLATAKKKIAEIQKNGPQELGQLDSTNTQLSKVERTYGDRMVEGILARLRYEAAKKAAKTDAEKAEAEKLLAQLKNDENANIDLGAELDRLLRDKHELVAKLEKVGATDGLRTLKEAHEARADLEDIAAARKDLEAKKPLEPALGPSVTAVKAKLADIKKVLADLGSPVFAASK